jgi:transposase
MSQRHEGRIRQQSRIPGRFTPDVRDWLPADHLARFVLDQVEQLDLHPFLAAYEPRMLLGVLLYAYCTGIRSCRQIERRCTEDIAFRILSGNSTPAHVTVARFRVRHEQALAGLLVASLKLCAAAGMVRLDLSPGWHQDRGQRRCRGQPDPYPRGAHRDHQCPHWWPAGERWPDIRPEHQIAEDTSMVTDTSLAACAGHQPSGGRSFRKQRSSIR